MSAARRPPIAGVVESALYFDDLPAAAAFYEDVLGLARRSANDRLVALDAGNGTTLLLFGRGRSVAGVDFPGGRIPPHDGHGPWHVALGVPAGSLETWEAHLEGHGVSIESRVSWERGGQSVYFRDPGGHSVELATPGIWEPLP